MVSAHSRPHADAKPYSGHFLGRALSPSQAIVQAIATRRSLHVRGPCLRAQRIEYAGLLGHPVEPLVLLCLTICFATL
eukprot:14207749-Alexandrium_andersonii.AAC.2